VDQGAVPSASKLGPADGKSRHARTVDPDPVTPSLVDPVSRALATTATDESGQAPGMLETYSTLIFTYNL